MDIDAMIGMAQPNKRRHKWTRDEDVVVVGLYILTGTSNQPKAVKDDLAELFGCPSSSVPMRFGNVDAILGDGKLTSYAQMTKEVCDELASLPRDEVKARVEVAHARLTKRRARQ